MCCKNLILAFCFDSAWVNITYVDPHHTFILHNSWTGCLTPFWIWRDLKSSLYWEEEHFWKVDQYILLTCKIKLTLTEIAWTSPNSSQSQALKSRVFINAVRVVILGFTSCHNECLSSKVGDMSKAPEESNNISKVPLTTTEISTYQICHFLTSMSALFYIYNNKQIQQSSCHCLKHCHRLYVQSMNDK